MADVIIVGDGPGGLSAALFLAKNGLEVLVFGQDETAMHWALLKNYLGLPPTPGSEFQARAKAQVTEHGATLIDARVASATPEGEGFRVVTEDGATHDARYLVLSEGKKPKLAPALGLSDSEDGVEVDRWGRTAIDRVYAVGRTARRGRSQAIISAGDGAAAAIDILARERGKTRFADWDSPDEAE